MKILIDSIKDHQQKFDDFEWLFAGSNYQVSFDVKSFIFEDHQTFSVDNLKELFPNLKNEIDGKIIPSTWNNFLEEIKENFLYCGEDKGIPSKKRLLNEVDAQEHASRVSKFIVLLREIILIPPEKVLIHEPDIGTVFHDYIMWGFSFILLHKNTGVFVSGYASD